MDIARKAMLDTMIELDYFCQKHTLEYYLTAGTLLGAVRHQGFIPWDDDIDILMPRKDYNRFIKLASELPEYLSLFSIKNNIDYRHTYAKLINNNVIVKEESYKPIIGGVWIDIFPLDTTFNNRILQKIQFLNIKLIKVVIALKYDLMDINNIALSKKLLYKSLRVPSKIFSRKYINMLMTLIESTPKIIPFQNKYLVNLHGVWGTKEVMPKSIFSTKKKYRFEDSYFWGPENADFWLRKVYGDYMTFPPVENRIAPHKITIIKVSKNYLK